MSGNFLPKDEDVERQNYNEFLDEVRDLVSDMRVNLENLRSGAAGAEERLSALRRATRSLRLAGHAVHSPLIKLIVHRLDEYLAELREPAPQQIGEVQVFLDRIESVADGETADEVKAEEMVRSLPAKRSAGVDFGKIEQKNVEIMVVVPEKAMSRIVERELAACGYRVSNVKDPFQALEMAVRTRPDMIIAAMELEPISGVDLGSALAAIGGTHTIPFAILTSYEWGNAKLRGLPARAAILRKGAKFGDDLAETLARFDIT